VASSQLLVLASWRTACKRVRTVAIQLLSAAKPSCLCSNYVASANLRPGAMLAIHVCTCTGAWTKSSPRDSITKGYMTDKAVWCGAVPITDYGLQGVLVVAGCWFCLERLLSCGCSGPPVLQPPVRQAAIGRPPHTDQVPELVEWSNGHFGGICVTSGYFTAERYAPHQITRHNSKVQAPPHFGDLVCSAAHMQTGCCACHMQVDQHQQS
jgi:hypothetical protein